ncbi:carbohydrate ABC transporter permease [Liberiplasma polymorphum]|uniref:carbohydrate ABC transporter permease n=1 Tax=Liberiplasma polymorphum TaxID=3374570 RepID=UPI003772CDD4
MNMDKIIPILKGIASGLVWGLGQVFNRQWFKGLFFFVFFAIFMLVEFVITGSYTQEFSIYDKMPGRDMTVETSRGYMQDYYYSYQQGIYQETRFLYYVAELNNLEFDENDGIFMDPASGQLVAPESRRVVFNPSDLYNYLGMRLREIDDEFDLSDELEPIAEQLAIDEIMILTSRRIREEAERALPMLENYDEMLTDRITVIAIEEMTAAELDPNDQEALDAYIAANFTRLRTLSRTQLIDEYAAEIYDDVFQSNYDYVYRLYYNNFYLEFLKNLYGTEYLKFEDINAFKTSLQAGVNTNRDSYNADAYNKMLVNLYFSYDLEVYERNLEQFDNFFHERAGFFVKGLWSIATLGEVPQRVIFQHRVFDFFLPTAGARTFEGRNIVITGHHSTQLLLRGIISTLLMLYFAVIMTWSIRDAYITAKKRRNNEEVLSEVDYFKHVYEEAFEYIVLLPALMVITFISIMPILFGMLVAFTNYNNEHIPPGQLISWVGLENFRLIFTLGRSGGMPFGEVFFRVLWWTLIWAVFSTITCFFGGFFQAIILNNKNVAWRKIWRGILILPWAIPALISQMVFRVMFADRGYINTVLSRTWVYDFLREHGMLGRSFAEAGTGIDRLLYFGNEHIQWITNEANPWFVRIFLIVLNIWLGFPFFMALMSGVMTSIDKSLYEAASIDGATGFQQFKFITMPLVLLATSPLLIMTFAGNFNNFGVIYFITGGGPGGDFTTAFAGQTDILISWIYKLTTDDNIRWYSMASVFSILIFLIIGTLSAWNFTRTRAFKEVD